MAKNEMAFDPKVIEAEEDLLIDYQFALRKLMSKKKISNSELAAMARISKARLSQILGADANPTVKTFARLFHALGEKLVINSIPHEQEVARNLHKLFAAEAQVWKFENTLSAATRADEAQMVVVVKSKAADGPSNDNYSPIGIADFLMIEPEAA